VITKENIEEIIANGWDRTDLFVTQITVAPGNNIRILIDGDNGVNLEDCVALSRLVEGSYDREVEDFSLDVLTHGVSESLVMPRQYAKNVGRDIKVKTIADESFEGLLKEANDTCIVVYFTYKERVEGKKKKIVIEKNMEIPYDQIKSGIIKVSFK
jgi:ribosome maturation factor RimP